MSGLKNRIFILNNKRLLVVDVKEPESDEVLFSG